MMRMPPVEMSAIAPRMSIADCGSSTITSMYLRKREFSRFSPSCTCNHRSRKIESEDVGGARPGAGHPARAPLTQADSVAASAALDRHGRRVKTGSKNQQAAYHMHADSRTKQRRLHLDAPPLAEKDEAAGTTAAIGSGQLDVLQGAERRQLLRKSALDRLDRHALLPAVLRRVGAIRADDAREVRHARAVPHLVRGLGAPTAARRV